MFTVFKNYLSPVPKKAHRRSKLMSKQEKIAHVVLAACRCCNLEQICFSCTDRRVMCQNNLSIDLPQGVNIEFANIREQCAWVHKDDPEGATAKAIELISTGVVRSQKLMPPIYEARPVTKSVLDHWHRSIQSGGGSQSGRLRTIN